MAQNNKCSAWMVSANPIAGRMFYGVYRLRDVNKVDHSGNRETRGGWYETKAEAEKLAATLNAEEKK